MRLLVTGSNGFVAGSVIAQAASQWEVHGIARSETTSQPGNIKYHQCDLSDTGKLSILFKQIKPDVVIHAAAIANIDFCEKNKSIAEKINIQVTDFIARLCANAHCRLVFCSTDTVFDGSRGFYKEEDEPRAVNYYAATKIEAEKIVLATPDNNAVARLSLVMGMPVIGKGNSFLFETIEKFKKGESVQFPGNEIRTPVDVITAGRALTELATINFSGIIHLAGNTCINRYEMARQIAIATGFSPDLVLNTDSNAIEGRAPRPNNASLDNLKAKKILKTPMLTLQEGLALTLNKK